MMTFFRSYIAPLLIVLTFVIAMVAVSARIFLPSDMMAPAPVEESIGVVAPPMTSPATEATGSDTTEGVPEVSWILTELANTIG